MKLLGIPYQAWYPPLLIPPFFDGLLALPFLPRILVSKQQERGSHFEHAGCGSKTDIKK